MRTENRDRAVRDFAWIFYEARALGLQALHDMEVMHDLVTDVDRSLVSGQRPFNDIDRAHHAGAETAWLGKDDFQLVGFFRHGIVLRYAKLTLILERQKIPPVTLTSGHVRESSARRGHGKRPGRLRVTQSGPECCRVIEPALARR